MSFNLVSLVMQHLGPEMIAKIAKALGLESHLASRAIGALVPGMLGSIAAKAATPGGAAHLAGVLDSVDPSALAGLAGNLGGGGQATMIGKGNALVGLALGDSSTDTLSHAFGRFAGLDGLAGNAVTGLVGTSVLGALAATKRSQGLDAGGLASMLSGQSANISAALPQGFGQVGLPSVRPAEGLSSLPIARVASGAASVPSAASIPAQAAAILPAAAPRIAVAEPAFRKVNWMWLLPLGAVFVGGIWYFADSMTKRNQAFYAEQVKIAEAKSKAEAEVKAKAEAEAARLRAEAEAKAKAEAEAVAAKARADAEAVRQKAEAEAAAAKARADAEARQKADADAAATKARADAEARQKAEADVAAAKARADADARQKTEADAAAAKQRADAEAKAKADAEAAMTAKQRADAEAKARADAEAAAARVRADADVKQRADAAVAAAAAAKSRADAEAAARLASVKTCQDTISQSIAAGAVRFRIASATITPESTDALNKAATAINACPNARVRVEGHTDSDGDETANKDLSDRRAKAVQEYLVKAGVTADRVTATGFGQSKPLVANDTPDNKLKNRRIEILVDPK